MDYRFQLEFRNQVLSMEQVYMPIATAPLVEPIVTSRAFYEEN